MFLHVTGGWIVDACRVLCRQSQAYQVPNSGEEITFSVDQLLNVSSINAAR